MANLGGLPNLGNKRLTILQKQLNSSRKNTAIVNDKLKESLDRFERSMDKEKQSESVRTLQKKVPIKNNLTEMGALKKCLRRRRESIGLEDELPPRYGVYEGASLDSMKPEVKKIISKMTPGYKRMKKVEKLKSMGYRQGMLVDYGNSLGKLFDVINRPKVKAASATYGLSPRYSLMREIPLGVDDQRTLSSSSSDDRSDIDDTLVQRRSASADGARTMQLPPIQGARRQSLYNKRRTQQPDDYSKTRTTRLPSLVRRLSSFGPY